MFELNEDGSPPGWGGSEKWLLAYEATESEVQHDTLAAFRIIDSDKFKLNSEPAPPGTMLESGLLEKLVATVKKMLAYSEAITQLDADRERDAAAVEHSAADGSVEAPQAPPLLRSKSY